MPPGSATVYVFFSSAMEAGKFSHAEDTDTAGGQFRYHLNKLLAKNNETADQIAAYYLQSVDEALKEVRSWLTKHPDRTWQMKTIMPDERGFWSAEDLQPGGYEVMVRGKGSGQDADWEGSVDLAPGRTISLPLTRPRFVHHE